MLQILLLIQQSLLLKRFPYDSLNIPWDKFYIWEPMRVKIPVNIIEKIPLQNEAADRSGYNPCRQELQIHLRLNMIRRLLRNILINLLLFMKDTTLMVVIDTLHEVTSSHSGFPFRYLNYPYQSDSIKVAVDALMKYLEERDSSIIYFTGIDNQVTPVWLNSKSDRYVQILA